MKQVSRKNRDAISSIFLLIVNLGIDSITVKPYMSHTSHRKVDFNEFVQNPLCCDMDMIIFGLHSYGKKHYRELTLWHFSSTFRSSHSVRSAYQRK